MKKLTILTVLAIVFAMSANATVWRVNNSPNVDADFSNLQDAENDANVMPFDTLYLEGSASGYGDVDVNKPIIIIGAGYFLEENDSTQSNRLPSVINEVDFRSGSEGSLIMGCMFTSGESVGNIQIRTSNITIARNLVLVNGFYTSNIFGIYIGYDNLNDIIIEDNYIDVHSTYSSGTSHGIYSNKSGLNILIRNNYIRGTSVETIDYAINLSGNLNNSFVIKNNVISANVLTNDGMYMNNILIEGDVSGINNYYFNNLCNSIQFGSSNNNQENVDMTTVFVDYLLKVDNGLQLKAGSPAIGAGFNGEDCGMFGGSTPYKLSGMPPIPAIFTIEQTGIGNSSLPIEVNLKAKSHR